MSNRDDERLLSLQCPFRPPGGGRWRDHPSRKDKSGRWRPGMFWRGWEQEEPGVQSGTEVLKPELG